MPSARMQRPVPGTISGTTPCTGTSGAAPRVSRCSPQAQVEWACAMSLMCRTPAHAAAPGAWSPGGCPSGRSSPSGKCWKRILMRMLRCPLRSKSIKLPASRRSRIGATTGGTSSTALRIPFFRSMMNSTSERPSGRPLPPASPIAFSCDADWSRNCTGRILPRY